MKFENKEGNTPIDADEAEALIPDHIETQGELNEWEQKNIIEAQEFFSKKSYDSSDILDAYFILGVHEKMFDNTWKWAGELRTTEKNIGIAPEKIREDIKNLCDDVKLWIKNKTYDDVEICVRFHRRIVGIHIFPNGNGRHGRLITDMLCKSLGVKPFTWGVKELVKIGKERDEYLKALKEADNNNYATLIKFVYL